MKIMEVREKSELLEFPYAPKRLEPLLTDAHHPAPPLLTVALSAYHSDRNMCVPL